MALGQFTLFGNPCHDGCMALMAGTCPDSPDAFMTGDMYISIHL